MRQQILYPRCAETQRKAKTGEIKGLTTLSVCNVATSSLVRETDIFIPTLAGVEIGVASTKAFTTQLAALMLLVTKIGKVQQRIDAKSVVGNCD